MRRGLHSRDGRGAVRFSSAAALLGVLGMLALGSSPAMAISQRGHVFAFAFGSLASPGGVGVDAASGDVYASDTGHNRVDVYEPIFASGELTGEKSLSELKVTSPTAIAVDNSASGSDPSQNDVYVVTKGHTIEKLNPEGQLLETIKQVEASGSTKKQKFGVIAGIAVDTNGNLFVAVQAGPTQEAGQLFEFNDAAENTVVSEMSAPVIAPGVSQGLAVDTADDLYEAARNVTSESPGQASLLAEVEEEFKHSSPEEPVFASAAKLDTTGKLLTPALDYEFADAMAVNPVDEPANQVSERDDVYVVNQAGVGNEKVSTVAQFAPEEGEHETGSLIQRFGAPGLSEGDAVAVDPKAGVVYVADAASGQVDVFALEPPGPPSIEAQSATSSPTLAGSETLEAKVDPHGTATTDYFEYGTESCASTPACQKTPSTEVGDTFADQAQTVPLSSLAAGTYYYRVVAQNAHGKLASAEQTFTIAASLGALPDGRAWEMVSPPDKGGAEPEPIRREGGLVESSISGDAITYVADGPIPANGEIVGNRNPEPTQVFSTADHTPGQEGWVSQDITTPVETGAGPSPGRPWEYELFSPTLALALVKPHIGTDTGPYQSPPLSPLLPGEEAGRQENTIFLRDQQPLSPEASEAADFEAAQKNGQAMEPHNAGYLPLVTQLNAVGNGTSEAPEGPGAEFGESFLDPNALEPVGASPDLTHVVFQSERENGHKGLYEWSEGVIHRVNVLEDGEELINAGSTEVWLGGTGNTANTRRGLNTRHAVSDNGARVFWAYREKNENKRVHLEVREIGETPEPQTLQLDVVRGGQGKGEESHAVFQTASTDGSKVFFTDEERLTADSDAQSGRPDLYVAELQIVGGHLSIKRLKDLTPGTTENADILMYQEEGGGVIGASENGSYVYFVANGALAPGATRGHCISGVEASGNGVQRALGTTCNLYVRHYNEATEEWEPTKLVAILSSEDTPDWGSGVEGDFNYVTSRVSPNGEYLAFMSERSLTGYDNEDVSSKAPGERLDEEVYLYNATSGLLVCASCNPTGARPVGVFDSGGTHGGDGEGIGLVVDRPEIWSAVSERETFKTSTDHWLAGSIPGWTNGGKYYTPYQSRYLSNKGRLFFNSADPLLPAGSVAEEKRTRPETVEGQTQEVGVENVYEYEPDGVGGCQSGGCIGLISSGKSEHESAFLDASETGDDVFFLTTARLSPLDTDGNFDIYDARACGDECPATPAPPAKACEGEECQGTPGAYAGATSMASGTSVFSGPGNVVLPKQGVLAEKQVIVPVKSLTRAQKLANALRTCRREHKKSKRLACEKQAKKKYGPSGKRKASKSTSRGASK
jgi:DNA-binding beta-propeller fold protein YncE